MLTRSLLAGHPPIDAEPDRHPVHTGEVWSNPVTGEQATLLELPWHNPQGRAVGELTALVGSRVAGEHRHPAMVERFTVIEGELTMRLDGVISVLTAGQGAEVRPGQWHDWWNDSDAPALVRVEVTPGERFLHMIETMFGLAREGYTSKSGMPHPLQLAVFGREFADVVEFRSPPPPVQRAMFRLLGPLSSAMGFRATYPQLSRVVNAPRDATGP